MIISTIISMRIHILLSENISTSTNNEKFQTNQIMNSISHKFFEIKEMEPIVSGRNKILYE